jgi:sulfonate transport system substrate-binding protein
MTRVAQNIQPHQSSGKSKLLRWSLTVFALLGLSGTIMPSGAADTKQFRIGYQKAANTLVLLKAHGDLEKRLRPLGVEVSWLEFTAGPQLLEGLNVGSVDFGYVGEVPPIFALAAGANFVYAAYELPTPEAEGILVSQDSPIHDIASLKGKKVAFNKGSDVHWLVVNALQKAGLTYGDIQPVYLTPPDARAAFQRGAIDAWAIWDPFFVAAQKQLGARVLTTATGIVNRYQFFLSAREFTEQNPKVLAATLDELRKTGQWIRQNYKEAAAELAPLQGLDPDVIETALRHYQHIYQPLDDVVLNDQQKIADTFFELKLIPKKISVRGAVLPSIQ